MQVLTHKVADIFVPVVVVIALVAFGVRAAIGSALAFNYGFVAAITVLIFACPCPVRLAMPAIQSFRSCPPSLFGPARLNFRWKAASGLGLCFLEGALFRGP